MVTLRRRSTVVTGELEPEVEKERHNGGDLTIVVVDDSSPEEAAVKRLRGRWELASVLNFLNVFGTLVSDKLKLTAEEIEMGLIESNTTNSQLHIALLKGIPPVNKTLEDGDAWITVLCKKLAPWWPWIAKDEIPITANKGEEISQYRGLDPIDRLRFLKALCELRVDQDDARTYIQENAKEGAFVSGFPKRKIGGDGKKTSYWFDGNDIQGYRLYREVNETSKSVKARKSGYLDISSIYWETEATNLDEFQRVARELSSSKSSSLAATGEMIETDAIPVVEKYQKKKERAMKKKMKQGKVVSVNFSRSVRATRSCRNRVPVNYTYEEYDKMISDAVEETEETYRDDEEGTEQQITSMGSDNSSEGNNKLIEYIELESDNDKENEESKEEEEEEETEPKGEVFNGKNRLRQRLTRSSALLV
ncbi:unnamed protein product [Cochlearia groenlandica]